MLVVGCVRVCEGYSPRFSVGRFKQRESRRAVGKLIFRESFPRIARRFDVQPRGLRQQPSPGTGSAFLLCKGFGY